MSFFCELQQELHVHNTFLIFSIFQPILVGNRVKQEKKVYPERDCELVKNHMGKKRKGSEVNLLHIPKFLRKLVKQSTNISNLGNFLHLMY